MIDKDQEMLIKLPYWAANNLMSEAMDMRVSTYPMRAKLGVVLMSALQDGAGRLAAVSSSPSVEKLSDRDRYLELVREHGVESPSAMLARLVSEALADPVASVEKLELVQFILKMTRPLRPGEDFWPLDVYDPEFGDGRECACGHIYERHFDTYDDMEAVGCKYCDCGTWRAPGEGV